MVGGSEGEMELQQPPPPPPLSSSSLATDSCERIKHQRKPFYGCIGVQSVIPRKQRSAINKRIRESTSPPLPDAKKLHQPSTEIELPQTKGPKKPKQNRKQGGVSNRFVRRVVSSSITKDEEEVVETLYGLAKMFSDEKLDRSREDEKSSEPKSSPLQDTRETCMLTCEAAIEESVKSQRALTIAEVTNLSSCVEGSPTETLKDYPLTKSTVHEPHTIFASHQIEQPLAQALLPKSEHLEDTPMDDVNLAASFKIVPGIGIKESRELELLHDQKHQNKLWPVTSVVMEQEQLQPIKDDKGSCTRIACEEGAPALWPGFSLTESNGGSIRCPSSWSTSNKDPSCLDSTTYVIGSSSTRCIIPNKEGKSVSRQVVVDGRKPWKKSSVHVRICYLIQASQTADKKASWEVPTIQLKATERPNLDVKSTNGVTDLRNSWDAAICSCINDKEEILATGTSGSSSRKDQNEIPSGIIQEKWLLQDQQPASKTYRNGTSSNQGGDFLSLSTGHGSLEFTTLYDQNHGRNVLESPSQNAAPNLCSISHCHSVMPLSLPNAWYLSPPYPADVLKRADRQQLQQLQFMDGLFYSTPHLAQGGLAKQQNHQIMWAAKLATENGSGRAMPDFPKRQNGTKDFPMVPCSQAILPFSAPVEKLSANMCPRPAQQHLCAVSSSTSSTKGNRHQQQQYIPSHYDLGGDFYAQGTPQLLCNSEQF